MEYVLTLDADMPRFIDFPAVNASANIIILGLIEFLTTLIGGVQSLDHVRLFATPWTAACQAPLFLTVSQSLLKLMSIESVMPSNHLMLCHPFSSCLHLSQHQSPMRGLFISGGQNIGASASASVLSMHIQD